MAARLLTPSSPIPPLQPFPLSLPTDNHRPGDCQPPPPRCCRIWHAARVAAGGLLRRQPRRVRLPPPRPTLNPASPTAAPAARAPEYLANFCPRKGEWREEPGLFNPLLPQLYRRTGRFHKLEHAKALMCVRCVAYPLGACPTSFPRGDLSCRQCGAASLSASTANPSATTTDSLPFFQPPSPLLSRRRRRQHHHHICHYYPFAQIYHTTQPIQTSRFYQRVFSALEHRHTSAHPNLLSRPIGLPEWT